MLRCLNTFRCYVISSFAIGFAYVDWNFRFCAQCFYGVPHYIKSISIFSSDSWLYIFVLIQRLYIFVNAKAVIYKIDVDLDALGVVPNQK
jgi:hypothetical protein